MTVKRRTFFINTVVKKTKKAPSWHNIGTIYSTTLTTKVELQFPLIKLTHWLNMRGFQKTWVTDCNMQVPCCM